MTEITASQTKEAIESKLKEWMDPENEGYGTILSLDFSTHGHSAYALVRYPDMIEINFLFYSPMGQTAGISTEYQKSLFIEESDEFHEVKPDEQAKEKNELILEIVNDVYKAMVLRFR